MTAAGGRWSWSSSHGTAALVLVIALLGLGGAILAGHSPPSTGSSGGASELDFTLPAAVWGVLFLVPVLVGFIAYLLRLALGTTNGLPMRLGASAAIAIVIVLVLSLLVPQASWNASSRVSVGSGGGHGGPIPTNGTGSHGLPNGTSGGGNGSAGNGTGGNGSGSNASGGGGSGSGSPPGGGGGGSGPGSGSGGGGSGGSPGNGTGNGTGGNGTGGSGPGGGGGSGGSGHGNGSGGGNASGGGGTNCSGSGGGDVPMGPIGERPIGGNCTAGSGGGSSGGGTGSGGNNTSGTPPRGAAPVRGLSFQVPNWVFLVIAVTLSLVVALLAEPGILRRLFSRRPSPQDAVPLPPLPADWGAAIQETRLAIERGEVPRESIVRLYGRLLGRVSPSVGDLDASTAEEIQRTRLEPLRVPSERSETITRMFEEARYSTHPIDRPAADRFVATMREVENDLSGTGAPR